MLDDRQKPTEMACYIRLHISPSQKQLGNSQAPMLENEILNRHNNILELQNWMKSRGTQPPGVVQCRQHKSFREVELHLENARRCSV